MKKWCALIFCAALVGCATQPPATIDLATVKISADSFAGAPRPRVELSVATLARDDEAHLLGATTRFASGLIFTRAFRHEKGAPQFEIVSAHADEQFAALGFGVLVSYEATATVTINGTPHVLRASAKDMTAGSPLASLRSVVEQVAVDLARQTNQLLSIQ